MNGKKGISNIIIAEDNNTLCSTLEEALEKRGFNIIGAVGNGKDVISLLPNNAVDLVLMDVEMPIMDGIATTEYISKNYPLVKVLMLSNYDYTGYIQESVSTGAKGYLLKNASPNEITTAIHIVIGGGNYFSPSIYDKLAKKFIFQMI